MVHPVVIIGNLETAYSLVSGLEWNSTIQMPCYTHTNPQAGIAPSLVRALACSLPRNRRGFKSHFTQINLLDLYKVVPTFTIPSTNLTIQIEKGSFRGVRNLMHMK